MINEGKAKIWNVSASLRIYSHSKSPDEISDALGLVFDSGWKAGESRKGSKYVHKENGWALDEYCDDAEEFMTVVESLLLRFSHRRCEVAEIGDVYRACIVCTILAPRPPGVILPLKVIDELAKARLSLGIDMYTGEAFEDD